MATEGYKIWLYTWAEIVELAEQGATITTLQGYLACGKDRKINSNADLDKLFQLWVHDVNYATTGDHSVPPEVVECFEAWRNQSTHKRPEVNMKTTLPPPSITPRFTWSYTALTEFETCALKYAHSRFYKDTPFVETDATRWGNRVHKALELDLLGTPNPEAELIAPYLKYTAFLKAAAVGGELLIEKQLAINESLKPTGWFDGDAWGRGVIDVAVIKNGVAYIFDWKTGKMKDDQTQLIVFCIFLALHRPDIHTFSAKFIWLKDDKVTGLKNAEGQDITLTRADLLPAIKSLLGRINRMKQAWDSETWQAIPSGLCRDYCGYMQCAHKNRR